MGDGVVVECRFLHALVVRHLVGFLECQRSGVYVAGAQVSLSDIEVCALGEGIVFAYYFVQVAHGFSVVAVAVSGDAEYVERRAFRLSAAIIRILFQQVYGALVVAEVVFTFAGHTSQLSVHIGRELFGKQTVSDS